MSFGVGLAASSATKAAKTVAMLAKARATVFASGANHFCGCFGFGVHANLSVDI